jgi:hypothetical protein
MPESNSDFPSEEDLEALGEFAPRIRDSRARRESISAEDLENAIAVTTDYLRAGWDTGGGRRLRQFIWSLCRRQGVQLCSVTRPLTGLHSPPTLRPESAHQTTPAHPSLEN